MAPADLFLCSRVSVIIYINTPPPSPWPRLFSNKYAKFQTLLPVISGRPPTATPPSKSCPSGPHLHLARLVSAGPARCRQLALLRRPAAAHCAVGHCPTSPPTARLPASRRRRRGGEHGSSNRPSRRAYSPATRHQHRPQPAGWRLGPHADGQRSGGGGGATQGGTGRGAARLRPAQPHHPGRRRWRR